MESNIRFRRTKVGRSPHGERGLKYADHVLAIIFKWSLSSRRAWIEILILATSPCFAFLSLSSRRAWIEILYVEPGNDYNSCRSPHGERGLKFLWICLNIFMIMSLSSRRAWIEIAYSPQSYACKAVALLTESVD